MIITCLVLFSCQRKEALTGTALDGSWRMVLVKDNVSGNTISKPSSIPGNVDIDNKDGEKRTYKKEKIDEQDSDGSANAFEGK